MDIVFTISDLLNHTDDRNYIVLKIMQLDSVTSKSTNIITQQNKTSLTLYDIHSLTQILSHHVRYQQ